MLQSKIFIGTAEKPADEQFNQWMKENNSHVVPKNYDFRLSRYSAHALCVMYEDYALDKKKEGKDPFTDEPVVESNEEGKIKRFEELVERWCIYTDFGKSYTTSNEAESLLKELSLACPYRGNKMLCTSNSCRLGCAHFRDACNAAAKKSKKS